MRSSVSKWLDKTQKASKTFDLAVVFDTHESVGYLLDIF
jgi:hypothetical protein